MRLDDILRDFLDGWMEPIEYSRRVYQHREECPGIETGGNSGPWSDSGMHPDSHADCHCISMVERRKEPRRQPSLIDQIRELRLEKPVTARETDGGGGGKPKSRPPGNLADPDEMLHDLAHAARDIVCQWRMTTIIVQLGPPEFYLGQIRNVTDMLSIDDSADAAHSLRRHWQRARLMLGYDNQRQALDAQCPTAGCNGTLTVERHQPLSVDCDHCQGHWPTATWVAMIKEKADG